jgi:GxxExxY protein
MLLHQELTDQIIQCFYKVYNKLGYGFLEKVYENALIIELDNNGLDCKPQFPITVYYDDFKVGSYFADLLVEDTIVVELKAATEISEFHEIQLINYLKATTLEVGLLLNFGKKPEFKRKIFSNKIK